VMNDDHEYTAGGNEDGGNDGGRMGKNSGSGDRVSFEIYCFISFMNKFIQ
jgi:hypothetical protein